MSTPFPRGGQPTSNAASSASTAPAKKATSAAEVSVRPPDKTYL
jgi:hypothetical protein